MDRDFVLRWPLGLGAVPNASFAIESDSARPVGMGRKEGSSEAPGDGTFSLVVFPPKLDKEARPPRDVVFLLDRSGSMGGWQIAAARRAIARSLDTLSSEDRVAVIAFDSVLDQMHESPSLIPATDRNRWSILEWLGTIEARGGTEMELALKAGLALLKRPRKKKGEPKPTASDVPARDPILVLVTDGQVGDEDRVLARLEKSLGATTLHVVGIDTSANAGLLTRLADSSGGTHDIVESEDRLDEVMDRIQERLVAPIVTDVRLEGDGIEILDDSVVPAKRPSLFPGVPLVLRGRVQGAGPGNVTIRGKKQGGSSWRVAVTPHDSLAPGLGALWARGRLQHLSDAYAVGEHDDSEALERRIVDLSTGFGVLCKFTAVVAIDPRLPEKPIEASTLRQIVQPVFDAAAGGMQVLGLTAHRSLLRSPKDRYFSQSIICHDVASMSEASAISDSDSHGYDVGDLDTPPVNRPAEQAMIRETLALLRPRSGRLDDVPAEMVAILLGDVSKVLAMLRADGWNSPWLESLERVLEVGKQNPLNRDTLRALLNGLALFASPFERWW